jgi:hypothetical protein
MVYAAIWRALPGPFVVRLLTAVVLVAAVVAVLFLWVFPAIAPYMPFNDNTVDPTGGSAATVVTSSTRSPL